MVSQVDDKLKEFIPVSCALVIVRVCLDKFKLFLPLLNDPAEAEVVDDAFKVTLVDQGFFFGKELKAITKVALHVGRQWVLDAVLDRVRVAGHISRKAVTCLGALLYNWHFFDLNYKNQFQFFSN